MLSNDQAVLFFEQMLLIRNVEETLLDLFGQGHLSGTVHTCIGQEACAVGLIGALDRSRDILFSNHRGHGHYLAYCDDVRGLIAEVMGLPDGVCQGLGGSQHIQRDNFYTNGIQGAGAPIVAGMALAEKRAGTGAVSVVHLGDGTFGEGTVYEALNIAALWELPVIFSVEHNRYAQTTASALQHAGDLAARAVPFGIGVTRVDGMDLGAVHAAACTVVDDVRSRMRPHLLFMDTYRFAPHSKGDDTRDPAEIAQFRTRDPIPALARAIGLEDAQQDRIADRVTDRISGIVAELLGKLGSNGGRAA